MRELGAGEDQPLPARRPDARRRPPRARQRDAVDHALRRARDDRRRARRGHLPGRRRARTSRARRWRRSGTRPAGTGRGQRIEITKRIPVAAGLGGGSADAAAVLRLALRRSGLGDRRLALELAAALGSDVPGAARAGARARARRGRADRAPPRPRAVRRPRAAVGRAPADRGGLRPGRPTRRARAAPTSSTAIEPLGAVGVNDLEPAARSLEPSIDRALERARASGARHALVCGSGPDGDRPVRRAGGRARAAAAALRVGGRRGDRGRARARAAHLAPPPIKRQSRARERLDVTYLVAGVCGVLGLAAFVGLILVPAVSRLRARLATARGRGAVALRARRDGRHRRARRRRRVRVLDQLRIVGRR